MKVNKVISSGIWYTVSNFLVSGMALITTPIFTRVLTQDEYGQYSNFATWVTLCTVFISLNITATIISAIKDYKGQLDTYQTSIFMLCTVIAVMWIIIISIFQVFFETLFSMKYAMILVLIIYILFQTSINIFQIRERYEYNYKASVAISVIVSIGSSVLSIILVLNNPENRLESRLIGLVLPTIIIGIILMVRFWMKSKKIDFNMWKYAIPICLPYIPHTLSLYILSSSDKIMVNKMCGSSDLALYSLGVSVGMIASILSTSMNSAYAPWLAEKLIMGNHKSIKKYSLAYIVVFAWLVMGVMLLSPEVLYVMGGSNYADSVNVLLPIEMGCVCQFVYSMYVNIEQIEKKTIGMAVASILSAILNIVLNMLLIPRYGYKAAAYTTLVGYFFLVIMHMILVRNLGYRKVYANGIILAIVLVMCLMTVPLEMLFENSLIRYGVIGVYAFITIFVIIRYKNRIRMVLLKNE